MKIVADLLPLALFFIAYQIGDIYLAVGTLMVAMPATMLLLRGLGHQPSKLQLLACAVVILAGGLTLALRNPIFILAKPTVIYWSFAVFLLAALWRGFNPVRSMLEPIFKEHRLAPAAWQAAAGHWLVALLALGTLNWLAAANLSEQTWVNLKTFGFPILVFILLLVQMLWLRRQSACTTLPQ